MSAAARWASGRRPPGPQAACRGCKAIRKAPVVGRVLRAVVHTRDVGELRFVALGVLTDWFAAEQGIEVSKREAEAYDRQVRAAMTQDLARIRSQRDDLAARLATAPPGAERERVQRELEQARQIVSALEEIGAGAPDGPAEAPVRAETATAFMRQRNIEGAL